MAEPGVQRRGRQAGPFGAGSEACSQVRFAAPHRDRAPSTMPDKQDSMPDFADDDAAFLRRAQAGEAEAFGELVERYSPRLHGYVARYVFNAEDVLDIVQDSFVDAYRGLHSYDPACAFLPWLHTVCKHRMYTFCRQQKQYRAQTQRVVDDALLAIAAIDDPDGSRYDEAEVRALRACVGGLDAAYQQLITWRYAREETVVGIAARLQVPIDRIGMRLSRLRAALRRCIEGRLRKAQQST